MKKILLVSCLLVILFMGCNKNSEDQILPETRISKYSDIIQKSPNNANAYIKLAKAYNDLGKEDSKILALQNADKALSLPLNNKEKSQALIEKSRAILFKQPDEALTYLDESITLNPKNEFPWRLKGIIYENKEDFDKAIEYVNKALKLDNKKAWSYCVRGRIYTKMEKTQEAIDDFSTALKYSVTAPSKQDIEKWTYYYRGVIYFKTGKWQQAINDLTKAEKLSKDNDTFLRGGIYEFRGYSYIEIDKIKEGIDDFKKYSLIDKEDLPDFLKIQLARAYFKNNEY